MPIQRQSEQFQVFDTGTRWARDRESRDLPKGLAGLVNSMGRKISGGMLDTRTAGWHYPEYDPRVDGWPEEDPTRIVPTRAEAEADEYEDDDEDHYPDSDPERFIPEQFVKREREARLRTLTAHLGAYARPTARGSGRLPFDPAALGRLSGAASAALNRRIAQMSHEAATNDDVIRSVRDATGINLNMTNSGGGTYVLDGRLDDGSWLVASDSYGHDHGDLRDRTEMERPGHDDEPGNPLGWSVGIYPDGGEGKWFGQDPVHDHEDHDAGVDDLPRVIQDALRGVPRGRRRALLARVAQMSYEDAMRHIDETLAAGEPEDQSDYSTDYYVDHDEDADQPPWNPFWYDNIPSRRDEVDDDPVSFDGPGSIHDLPRRHREQENYRAMPTRELLRVLQRDVDNGDTGEPMAAWNELLDNRADPSRVDYDPEAHEWLNRWRTSARTAAVLFPPCPNCGQVKGFEPYPWARGMMWCNDRSCQHVVPAKELAHQFNDLMLQHDLEVSTLPEVDHPTRGKHGAVREAGWADDNPGYDELMKHIDQTLAEGEPDHEDDYLDDHETDDPTPTNENTYVLNHHGFPIHHGQEVDWVNYHTGEPRDPVGNGFPELTHFQSGRIIEHPAIDTETGRYSKELARVQWGDKALDEIGGAHYIHELRPVFKGRRAAVEAQDPTAQQMQMVVPPAGGYQPGHRVGLPWRDQVIRGTVIGVDGDAAAVRWDDGQYSSEEPRNIQLL